MALVLPTPTAEETEEFAALYLRLFGVELDPEQASEAATLTLQLFCLCTYGARLDGAKNGKARHPADP